MQDEVKSRYGIRRAQTDTDLSSVLVLRRKAFAEAYLQTSDSYDTKCETIMVEHLESQTLVASFRLMLLRSGSFIDKSYSAQFYNLDRLKAFDAPALEVGRFCVDPARSDPEILRVAWGAIAQYVDDNNAEILFGCSSFQGTDATPYKDAFAFLNARHLAPALWRPQAKAQKVIRFPERPLSDPKRALESMPPLLRSYLLMGGWVSDHAVVDEDMNTLHVFTGVEITKIPEARKRLLRANALKIS